MKRILAVLLILVMGFSITGCNTQPKMGAGDKVIATSGDDKILLRDFLYALGSFKMQTEYMYAQMGGDFGASDFASYWTGPGYNEGSTMFDDIKADTMTVVQNNAVLYKLAQANNITYNEEEIKTLESDLANHVQQLQLQNSSVVGDRQFYEMYYVTPDEVLEAEKISSTVTAYKDYLRSSITPTDEEIKAYYEDPANEAAIEDIRQVTVAHILINSDDTMTEEQRTAAKATADDILARAEAGEDFGEMAAMYSEDPGSKDNKGEYTITRNENFVPEFMDWTFAVDRKEGDIGMVETSYGYHIMKYVSTQGYDEAMVNQIKSLVVEGRLTEEVDALLLENAEEWVVDQEMYDSITYYYGQDPENIPEPAEETATEESSSEAPAEEAASEAPVEEPASEAPVEAEPAPSN
jgi:foldase protein PrsA